MQIANFLRVPRSENAFINYNAIDSQGVYGARQYHSHHAHSTHDHYPEALPLRHHCKHIPGRGEALGNVYISDEEQLREWLLVARPVTKEEAERRGGCIIFTPKSHSSAAASAAAGSTANGEQHYYYCISDPDDAVYGRAMYHKQGHAAPHSRKSHELKGRNVKNRK